MALQVKQSLKLSQQLVMTPQLQQAIKLLQLNRMELMDAIQEELEINPVLEDGPLETADAPDIDNNEPVEPISANQTDEVKFNENTRENDIDWESYLGEYNSPYQAATPTDREQKEAIPFENIVSQQPGLIDQLQWQLLVTNLTDAEKRIGETILGNIKPTGYLENDLEEIAQQASTDIETVEYVLSVIQTFDPPGIAARDVRECLLIQAKQQDMEDTVVWRVIDQGLDLLANRNYKALAKKVGTTLDKLADAIEIISSFDPKPGRAYSSDIPQYITPDIYIIQVDDEFKVMLNEEGLPKLKINPMYRQALTNPDSVPEQAKEFIQEKMRSAVWLIRSIHQRQRTIFRVTESIAERQRDFLLKGISHLKPMVLKDVADDVEMHESTVSRVTTNKYVHTPQGIFELKFFFNSAIQRFHGEALASESVKERIRQIISSEDPVKPLSDDAIKQILGAENINIARRTVAKYREALNILSSSKRKQPLLKKKRRV